MLEAVTLENYRRSALGRAGILASVIARAKKVALLELRKNARVAFLGQIMNIGGRHGRKF